MNRTPRLTRRWLLASIVASAFGVLALTTTPGMVGTVHANGDSHSGGHDTRTGPGRGIGYDGVGQHKGATGGHGSSSSGHSGSPLMDEVFRGHRRGYDADRGGHDDGHEHDEPHERPH